MTRRTPGARGARLDLTIVPAPSAPPRPLSHRGAPGDDAVVVEGLHKRYRGTVAVAGLDLHAPAGAVTALLGPNGAGKTTTVEICEGLRRADAGTVRVLGRDPRADAAWLRPRVGVMLQDGGLPGTAAAGAALRHVAAMYAAPRDVGELGERLGLDAFTRTPVRRLSGGQRQRLALAAAVVGRPRVVFLDEPSAGMDAQARLAVWELVRELRADGVTILLTTHAMAEAEELADRVVVVDHGRVIAAGTTAEVVRGGGATIRVSVVPVGAAAPADGAALAAGLAAVLGVPAVATATTGTLEVLAASDPSLVHAVTGWARDEGLLVTALSTGRRTLEDVFLDLTGRRLR